MCEFSIRKQEICLDIRLITDLCVYALFADCPLPAVYMCEWEKAKKQPNEKTEEGGAAEAAEAATAAESQEGESSSQGPPFSAGVTYELCAGLVDKPGLSLEEIARQEVLEECGYDVPASKLKRITSYR